MVEDISNNSVFTGTPFSKTMLGLDTDDTLINKKAIERRYAFENKLIRAISLGQSRGMTEDNSEILSNFLEKRTNDPLQIQTISLHCGIMDAQYFSKQFKAYSGMTPFEYRRKPHVKK